MSRTNTIIEQRSKNLSDLPKMVSGNMALDDGHLMFDALEKERIIESDISAVKFIRETTGGKEFIYSKKRWCLWIEDNELTDALKIKFDFIVCNLPYLATDEILDIATDGGAEGFEIPKKIFDSALKNLKEDGKFIFVTSSLSNYSKLIDYTQKLGLKTKIIAQKKLFFEELILVEAIN